MEGEVVGIRRGVSIGLLEIFAWSLPPVTARASAVLSSISSSLLLLLQYWELNPGPGKGYTTAVRPSAVAFFFTYFESESQ